jgi:hypothetical protein
MVVRGSDFLALVTEPVAGWWLQQPTAGRGPCTICRHFPCASRTKGTNPATPQPPYLSIDVFEMKLMLAAAFRMYLMFAAACGMYLMLVVAICFVAAAAICLFSLLVAFACRCLLSPGSSRLID